MPVPAGGQLVGQRSRRVRVVADDEPAGLTRPARDGRLLPPELVARVRDRTPFALLVMLRGKSSQYVAGLAVIGGVAEQGRQFFDATVFEQPQRLGARGEVLLGVGALPIIAIPVFAVFERIAGQVDLDRVWRPDGGEGGQVAQRVRLGERFGDLSLIGGVAAQ